MIKGKLKGKTFKFLNGEITSESNEIADMLKEMFNLLQKDYELSDGLPELIFLSKLKKFGAEGLSYEPTDEQYDFISDEGEEEKTITKDEKPTFIQRIKGFLVGDNNPYPRQSGGLFGFGAKAKEIKFANEWRDSQLASANEDNQYEIDSIHKRHKEMLDDIERRFSKKKEKIYVYNFHEKFGGEQFVGAVEAHNLEEAKRLFNTLYSGKNADFYDIYSYKKK